MLPNTKKSQRGVALFFAILALLVLSAVTAALVLLSATETTINSNYRSEEVAFFAAKAGLEEIMDRMMTSTTQTPAITPPSALPSSTGGVVYLINPGSAAASTIQPWNPQYAYADDEFCHAYSAITGLNLQTAPPDVPCTGQTSLPTGASWYTSVTSNAPWSGTGAALPFVWARVALKLNGSETYLAGGTTPTINTYAVNSAQGTSSPVCWNGSSEVVLPAAYPSCSAWSNSVTPVYLVTSLAVTSSGSRKMVQADIASAPIPNLVYGLFATSTLCSSTTDAVMFSGNGFTDSYSSQVGAYGGSNQSQTGGDIGSNGGVNLAGNATISGVVGVQNPGAGTGTCNGNAVLGPDLSTSGNAGIYSGPGDPSHLDKLTCLQTGPGAPCSSGPLSFPTPPAPNPPPPTTNYTGGSSLVPGSYGNITLTGNTAAGATLTLAPGVYNINSLNMSGNATLAIYPPGHVTLNIAGNNTTTPLTLAGNANAGGSNPIPSNLLINYAGTDEIFVDGNGSIYSVIDAPNTKVDFGGNGNIYGAVVGGLIHYHGNAGFHFDRSIQLANSGTAGYFSRIAYRELPY